MPATVILCPIMAGMLKNAHGFKTKAGRSEYLSKNVEVDAGTMPWTAIW
jgi:hypothetical protein